MENFLEDRKTNVKNFKKKLKKQRSENKTLSLMPKNN